MGDTFELQIKATTPETGYLPAESFDDLDAALVEAERWAKDHPNRGAQVEHIGTNEVWSVIYRRAAGTIDVDADGEEVRSYPPGVIEVVADYRERPVLSIEPHPETPDKQVITEAAGLEGIHAAWVRPDPDHPMRKDGGPQVEGLTVLDGEPADEEPA